MFSIWLVLGLLSASLEVALLTSLNTPFLLEAVLALVPYVPGISLSVIQASSLNNSTIAADLVLDYSYHSGLHLASHFRLKDLLIMGMYKGSPSYQVQGIATFDEEARQVVAFISATNLTRVFLAHTVPEYQRFASALNGLQGVITEVVCLHEKLTEVEVEQFVGRVLKPSGAKMVVLYIDEATGALLIPTLAKYHIYKKGFAYLVADAAIWGQTIEGMLYFTDSAAVNATSRLNYEALVLTDLLRQLVIHKNSVLSGDLSYMRRSFTLVNIVGGKPRPIPFPWNNILFPGNLTTISKYQKPIINVWAELEALDSDGSVSVRREAISSGVRVGYQEANRRHDLTPTYQFVNRSVSFEAFGINKTWIIQQALGYPIIAYHSFGLTATAINNLLLAFQEQNLPLPVTALSTSPTLSDPERFPMFLRTISSSIMHANVMISFFRVFRWKRVAIIHADDEENRDFAHYISKLALESSIQIVNKNTTHQLPVDLKNSEAALNSILQGILQSTVRVIVISHPQSRQIAARMYDLGVRAGDYLLCIKDGLSYANYAGGDDVSRKARTVARGAMQISNRLFSGQEGPRVKTLLTAFGKNNIDFSCCARYDSAMLVTHAVHYMLFKGLVFEEGQQLIRVMRKTRFQGCQGPVQIESDSNDIRLGEFSVMNAHLIGENETLELVEAAIFSPERIQVFSILPSLLFPDQSSHSFPDSWEMDKDCPYFSKDIRDFPQGQYLAIGLCFSYALLTALLIYTCGRPLWTVQVPVLMEKGTFTSEDGYFVLWFLVEFLQILELGPELGFPLYVSNTVNILSVNLWHVVRFSKGVFWGVEGTILAVIVLYTVLCGVRFSRLDSRLGQREMCRALRSYIDTFAPPLSSLCFLSIVSTVMTSFVCDKATGPSFTDSFMTMDCWERCWSGTHLRFSLVSGVLLGIYVPLAVFSRPHWQQHQTRLHIKANPRTLLGKSVLQLVLIAAYVSLPFNYPLLHALLYLSSNVTYTVFSLTTKPYNYERANLWERLTLISVLLYGILGILKQANYPHI